MLMNGGGREKSRRRNGNNVEFLFLDDFFHLFFFFDKSIKYSRTGIGCVEYFNGVFIGILFGFTVLFSHLPSRVYIGKVPK